MAGVFHHSRLANLKFRIKLIQLFFAFLVFTCCCRLKIKEGNHLVATSSIFTWVVDDEVFNAFEWTFLKIKKKN